MSVSSRKSDGGNTGSKWKVSLNISKKVILSDILGGEYFRQDSLVNYIEGTMGIGKSSIFKQLRKMLVAITEVEWGLIDLRMAAFSASDLQGIPFPIQQDGLSVLKWLKDGSLPGIGNHPKRGIILLDEFNQVEDGSVISLMYQLILDRKINDYHVPDGWYICCAGNREEDGGVYNKLKAPVRDRLAILEVELPTKEWLAFAESEGYHPAVISYIRENDNSGKDVLHTYDGKLEADGDEKCLNYVFATPRSWEEVSNTLYMHESFLANGGDICRDITAPEILQAKICARVGSEIGVSFYTYYKQTLTIPLDDIFNTEWKNNMPTLNLRKSLEDPRDAFYLTSLMPTITEDIKKFKIIAFAAYVNVPATTITLMVNCLTNKEKLDYTNYMTVNNCQKLLISSNVTISSDQELLMV